LLTLIGGARALGNDKNKTTFFKHLLTIFVLNENRQANKFCLQIKVKLQLNKEPRSVVKIVNKQIEANKNANFEFIHTSS
jgi:hypothetical protein